MMTFRPTPKQIEAQALLASPARHILLRGGSRSGKTFLLCRAIVKRCLKAPKSTHVILRFRFNHLKASIIEDTFPSMMETCFPGLPYKPNKSDWFIDINGARVLFGGLDDKERTEKILGQEHSTILLNECSQISYSSRNKAVTRAAQNVGLVPKIYYDCNPPKMGHWSYRMFMKKQEPRSGELLKHPENYATLRMNPGDNLPNLPEGYIEELEALPASERLRFLEGEFQSQVESALWTYEGLDKCRVAPAQVPELRRIVVAIDPSGCQGPEDFRSDEIGIVVAGRGTDGRGYVLEDLSGRYSPEGWAKAALTAFDNHDADRIVAEKNFGGAMVASTIRTARAGAPVKLVTASRGKTVRAEPVAALYEQEKIKHVGIFPDLEDQMCNFSTAGYMGEQSPDRADANVWALSELMLKHGVAQRVRVKGV